VKKVSHPSQSGSVNWPFPKVGRLSSSGRFLLARWAGSAYKVVSQVCRRTFVLFVPYTTTTTMRTTPIITPVFQDQVSTESTTDKCFQQDLSNVLPGMAESSLKFRLRGQQQRGSWFGKPRAPRMRPRLDASTSPETGE
jgi:hypothetical protein